MKRLSIVMVFIVFGLVSAETPESNRISQQQSKPAISSALIDRAYAEQRIGLDEWVRYQIYALFDDSKLPLPYQGTIGRGWATPVLINIRRNWDLLSSTTKEELQRYRFSMKGILERPPALPDTVGNKQFLVHYTTNILDTNAVSNVDQNVNGIPDFVDTVMFALDTTWSAEIGNMGYTAPPADKVAGGDSRIDIYLVKLGNEYGLTSPEELIGDNPNSKYVREHYAYNGYISLANDFSQQTMTGSAAIRATIAHEFFHLVQFGYNPYEQSWLMEATATWMEEEVFPALASGTMYLDLWFDQPSLPLDDLSGVHEYGSWIFFRFLKENAGGRNLIRYIWYQSVAYDLLAGDKSFKAISYVLQNWGAAEYRTFKKAFAGFATANLMKIYPPYDYQNGNKYPAVFSWTVLPENAIMNGVLERHASRYYLIDPSWYGDSLLTIRFTPEDLLTRFAAQAVIRRGTTVSVRPFDSTLVVTGDPTLTELYIVVMNYDTVGTPDGMGGKRNNYSLKFNKTLDMQLFATAPETFAKGTQYLQYNIYYRYNGPDSVQNVVLRDSLPAGTKYYSSTGGGIHSNGVITWNLGTVAHTDTFRSVQGTVTFSGECGDIINDSYFIQTATCPTVYGPAVVTHVTGGNCYEITEIQLLPTIDPSFGFEHFLRINNSGQIVGTGFDYPGDELPFFIDHGVMYALPLLPVTTNGAHAYDINDNGHIAGSVYVEYDLNWFVTHAVIWKNGGITDIHPASGDLYLSEAIAINNSGWIAVTAKPNNKPTDAMIYREGQISLLDSNTSNRTWAYAYGINDSGHIVGEITPYGSSYDQAFVFRDTGFVNIGAAWSSTPYSRAHAINNLGHIVGRRETTTGSKSAFMYQNGSVVGVGLGYYSRAIGINDSDQVVGSGWSQSYANDEYATLYERGQKINLNNVIPKGNGWFLKWASDINNKGQIVGVGQRYGQNRIFLLSKKSQPTEVNEEKDRSVPFAFVLSQNYPNPFNPTTTINYSLPVVSRIDIKVYNILGQEVVTLVNDIKLPGRYTITWNATGYASGVYFYRLHAGKYIETKKLVLLK